MSPDPVIWGFKAIKPFTAEHPIGSGTLVNYGPGDEVPASEWGRAAGFMVEAGTIMRYARNVAELPENLPPKSTAAENAAALEYATRLVSGDEAPPEEDGDESDEADENDGTFPHHEGSGWYVLSNGEKIRGKPAALSAQAALDVAAEGA